MFVEERGGIKGLTPESKLVYAFGSGGTLCPKCSQDEKCAWCGNDIGGEAISFKGEYFSPECFNKYTEGAIPKGKYSK